MDGGLGTGLALGLGAGLALGLGVGAGAGAAIFCFFAGTDGSGAEDGGPWGERGSRRVPLALFISGTRVWFYSDALLWNCIGGGRMVRRHLTLNF